MSENDLLENLLEKESEYLERIARLEAKLAQAGGKGVGWEMTDETCGCTHHYVHDQDACYGDSTTCKYPALKEQVERARKRIEQELARFNITSAHQSPYVRGLQFALRALAEAGENEGSIRDLYGG